MKANWVLKAAVDGASVSGGVGWLLHNVLFTDAPTLAGALLGGVFGLWLTTDEVWARIRAGVRAGRDAAGEVAGVDGGQKGWRMLNVVSGLGLLLALVVLVAAWSVHLLPHVPLIGSVVQDAPKPVVAGLFALVGLAIGPRIWGRALDAFGRLIDTMWRNHA